MTDRTLAPGCGANVGGAVSLELYRADQVEQFYPYSLGVDLLGAGIQLRPDATRFMVDAAEESLQAQVLQRESEHGTYYEVAVSVQLGKDTPDLALFCAQNERRTFLAVVRDGNGVRRVYGTPTQPLTLLSDHTTGAAGTDRAGRTLRLQGSQRRTALGYNPPVYLVTGGDGAFFINDQSDRLTTHV